MGERLGEKLGEKLGERLTKNQKAIIDLMQGNAYISITEISKKIKISTTAIEKNIAKLKKLKIIERIGPDKGGYWKIVKNIEK